MLSKSIIHEGAVYCRAATYTQDRKFRKEATNILRRVTRFLKEDINYINARHKEYFSFFLGEVSSKFNETLVVLGPSANKAVKGELQVAVNPPPGTPRYNLVINSLPPEFYEQKKWQQLETLHQHIDASTWVHEFIHLLDYMRREGEMTEGGQTLEEQVEETLTQSKEDYVNEPTEYNAHYQQLMHRVDEWLITLSDDEFESIGSDFNLFQEEVEKLDAAHQDFIPHLNEKYHKKFVRRLHDRWES